MTHMTIHTHSSEEMMAVSGNVRGIPSQTSKSSTAEIENNIIFAKL